MSAVEGPERRHPKLFGVISRTDTFFLFRMLRDLTPLREVAEL